MRIAIDLRVFRLHGHESNADYLENLFSRIAQQQSASTFFYLFDSPYPPRLITSSNITPLVIKPMANGPLGWKYWYNFKLPRIMKTHAVEVFLAASNFSSQTTSIDQLLFIHDLGFVKRPADYSKSYVRHMKSVMPGQFKKAKKVLVPSKAVKNEILESFKIDETKIDVVYGASSDNSQPLPWYEREYTKDKYAGGKDFFLFDGYVNPASDALNLIKAFSQFKKWQQSNMKLLLVGEWSDKCSGVLEQLESFRFREDVVLLEGISSDTRSKIRASAYAMVDPSLYAGFGMNMLDAMRAETPVICSNIEAFRETAGDAAGYFEAGSTESLADTLKKIYKDESWRQDLIEKGKERYRVFDFEESAKRLWQEIIHARESQSA